MVRKANTNDIEEILRLERKYFTFPRTSIDINDFIVEDNLHGYGDMKIIIDEGYIGNILVDERFRRNGIADEIIDSIINIGIENRLSFITLEVRTSNYPAINLYSKHGFKEEGILKNHYSNPKEDAIVMTKRSLF